MSYDIGVWACRLMMDGLVNPVARITLTEPAMRGIALLDWLTNEKTSDSSSAAKARKTKSRNKRQRFMGPYLILKMK